MKKHYFAIAALLLALVLLASACGGTLPAGKSDGAPAATGNSYYEAQEKTPVPTVSSPASFTATDTDSGVSNQKLVKTLSVVIETLEFDETIGKLRDLVEASGGYVEKSTVNGQSYQNTERRTASFTIRVPAGNLDKTEEALAGLGNITSSTANVSDITLTYADTASRVAALEAQRDSLLSMLQKAEDLKDLLTIQDHLTEVEYQLESYASKLRIMDNQVEYSSISLQIREVRIYTEPEPEDVSFGTRLAKLFKNSLKRVGTFFEDLALFVLGRLPILLIWGVFILAVVLIVKLITRKSKAKKMKKPVVPLQEPPFEKKD